MFIAPLLVLALSAPPRDTLERQLAALEPKVATDARAACNAGWLRFQLGDAQGAARDLDSGIGRLADATGDDARVLGACLYNRGRVHEAAKQRAEATAAYQRSLALRPGNAAVEKRLQSLGGAAPTRAAWSTRTGPWKKAPAALATAAWTLSDHEREPDAIALVGLEAALPGAALDRAALVWVGRDPRVKGDDYWGELVVVVHLGDAWLPVLNLGQLQEGGQTHEDIEAALDLAADALGPRLVLRYTSDHLDNEAGHSTHRERRLAAVWPAVGGGLATRNLLVGHTETYEPLGERLPDDPEAEVHWEVEAAVDAKGILTLRARAGEPPADLRALFGSSPLRVRDTEDGGGASAQAAPLVLELAGPAAAVPVVQRRLDALRAALGIASGTVTHQGDRVVVSVTPTGTCNAAGLAALGALLEPELARRGVLAIHATGLERAPEGPLPPTSLVQPPALTGEVVEDASASVDELGLPRVELILTAAGAAAFEQLTTREVKKVLAIVFDGQVVSSPVVMEPIRGNRVVISFGSHAEARREAQILAAVLRAGTLASELRPVKGTASCP